MISNKFSPKLLSIFVSLNHQSLVVQFGWPKKQQMLKWKCHRKIHGQPSNWGAKVKEEVGQFWSLAILQFCREFYKTGHISPILSPADSPPSKTNLGQEIKSILIKTTNTDFRSRPPSLIYFVKFSLYHALIYIRYFMIPLTQPHSWY